MKRLEDIRLRDPFILLADDTYYLYGTIDENVARELYVHKSRDLIHFEEPTVIYTIAEDSWATRDLWAPEVHAYKGKYYLFLSLLGKDGLRGTEISVADTPEGPFIPLSGSPITPAGQSCIDGTLYVENGQPYLIYSHDWPDCYREDIGAYVGEISALPLTDDLAAAAGESFLLFTSKDAPLSDAAPTHCRWQQKDIVRYGSDGPFVTQLSDGRPCLLWSPIPGGNYVVLGAVADSIRSEWKHYNSPIFSENGGHPMVFCDRDGERKLVIHWPEVYWHENARILPLVEKDGILMLK